MSQTQSAILEDGTSLEELAAGLLFGEGPAWDANAGRLLFSDIAGDTIYSWSESTGVEPFRQPSSKANGLAFDRHGGLVICEHATSRLTRLDPDGTLTTLASHYDGRELNSPNDVIVASDGSAWFSDPPGGREEFVGVPRPRELDFSGVFRVDADGTLALVADDFELPNGLCFAPDDSCIYINDTIRSHIRRLEVEGSSVRRDEILIEMPGSGFPTPGVADGMKCTADGRLLATGPNGIWVIGPDGEHIETIETPDTSTNMAFGDADRRTLYVTTLNGLYRVRLKVAGAPLPG
jgi:gluconolactonase